MAGTVAPMDVRMATACAGAVGDVTAFCRAQGISRKTFYKWRRRFVAQGVEGLAEGSRRPARSPETTPAEVEDEIVRRRKQLLEGGLDAGPETIRSMLLADAVAVVPSRATIARILTRRGLVVPAPQKRPKSSLQRFVYARPNECWQSDWSAWWLADGRLVAIAGTLDDHSRLLVGLSAAVGDGTAELVWSVMAAAIAAHGVPQRSLTDNGMCYSMARRGGISRFELNLAALGCQSIASSPYHPQTCGKIERFWQTLKKWLTAHETRHGAAVDVAELNRRLAVFAEYYNTRRPHRALHGRTPAHAFAATVAARPADRPLPEPLTVHTGYISARGVMAVGRFQIHVGSRWKGHTLTAIKDGHRVAIFAGHRLVRALDLNPERTYQPATEPGQAPH
jgi:transposase InsO family protein